jgi:phosphoserine aminotransferase
MYNALPLTSVEAICDLMKEFSEKHASVALETH